MGENFGRVTLPSEENFLQETIDSLKKLKADAIRDSDGTKLPDEIKDLEAKIYTTYFVARGHNEFAKKHMDNCQHFYLMSDRVLAKSENIEIEIMKDYFKEQVQPDYDNDVYKYWQVIDRTTGQEVDKTKWSVNKENNTVILNDITPFHIYTVNFLAYAIWDPTQMYNHITNDWKDKEHEIPFDVRYEESWEFAKTYLKNWLKENPKTDIVRFTTFFYHFTLVFNAIGKEKFVEWFGYTGSVSPKALEDFAKEYGYELKAEDFVDEGYYNSIFRIPTKEFKDYINFMQKFVSQKAKELVDMVHDENREAVMFLGDNWIGTEPFGEYFKDIGLDGVVGSVGDGVTLRLISDIENVKFTEGRFLPYFFPDTFYEGNDPTIEAKDNWRKARRALVRKPVDRIGYGGYLSLAYKFPEFMDYISKTADEFRYIYDKIKIAKPYTSAKVAILNSWGKIRSWMPYIVAHGKWYKLSYSYQGITEALSGMDMDVQFINFEDIKNGIDPSIDVIINAGDAYTAFSGGENFLIPEVVENIRKFVYNGGGFIGIGEPSAAQFNGAYFQLSDILGVDKEIGYSQSTNKYFIYEIQEHFIKQDIKTYDFGEGKENIYAIDEHTQILSYSNNQVNMATRQYGKGRSFYITGLPYSLENTRLLKRAIHYVSGKEEIMEKYFSTDLRAEVLGFEGGEEFAVLNNSNEEVETLVFGQKTKQMVKLEPSQMIWIKE